MRGIPATVWILGFVSLLMDISSEMVNTLLPLYLTAGLGASALAVGLIEGGAVAVATVMKFASGLIADLTQRAKPLAVLGYGLGAASRFILPFAATVDAIVLAKAVDRVGKGIRGTPRDAMIAAVTPPARRGEAFGLRKSLDSLGGFLGPLLAVAAMLALSGNIKDVFWLATLPAALAVALLAFGVHEPATAPKGAGKPGFRLRDALRLTPALHGVIALAGVIMLARFSEAFVLLKALEAGFTPAWVPLAMVLMHAVYAATAWPAGWLSDRIGRRGLLILSLLCLMAAHLVLAFAGNIAGFLAGTLLWGLHMGLSQGLLGAMIAHAAPDRLRGSAFGTFNLVTGLVLLAGNTAAGWLWMSQGPAAPFIAGAALSAVAAALLMLRRPGLA